jgi:excisionase family DNA binding protein
MPISTTQYSKPEPSNVARLAEESSHSIQDFMADGQTVAVRLTLERPDGKRADLSVPPSTVALIASLLKELGNGKDVAVISTDAELTTQEAADMLNVSRPYLVKLLNAQQIPFRSVGPRRRILLEDLLQYKERETAMRHRGLDQLVAESQKLGLY